MLSARAKELFAKLDLELCPVAVKFSSNVPEGYENDGAEMMLCQFIKYCQTEEKPFYIDIREKPCMGKCIVGAEEFAGSVQSGLIGWESALFRTPAANAHLYHEITRLKPGACNYIVFSPVADCDFDPDLIFFIAPADEAFTILRATSWVTGDVFESKFSVVLNCAWMFSYPYVSGKVNMLPTAMQYGQRKTKPYEPGQQMIIVPFQKIDELIAGLDEMQWVPFGLSDDPEKLQAERDVLDVVDSLEEDPSKPIDIREMIYKG